MLELVVEKRWWDSIVENGQNTLPDGREWGFDSLRFAKEILEGEPSNPKTPVKWLGKVSYREMV